MRMLAIARVMLMAVAALVWAAPQAWAQRAQEDAVKATFLTRFASFIEWPDSAFAAPDAPLVLCISGDADIATLAERAAVEQRINGRELTVRRIGAVAREMGCHVLYLAGAEGQPIAVARDTVRGEPVLTVTDQRHGSTRGAVHFVLSEGRVRFHVDRTPASAGGLRISSRLLNIALSVRGRD